MHTFTSYERLVVGLLSFEVTSHKDAISHFVISLRHIHAPPLFSFFCTFQLPFYALLLLLLLLYISTPYFALLLLLLLVVVLLVVVVDVVVVAVVIPQSSQHTFLEDSLFPF